MLEKRQSLDVSNKDPHCERRLFFQYHMAELLNESGRLKYYKAYEFIKKQVNLQQYWRRAINLYLKHFLKGFAVHWSDLNYFFDIDGSKPIGLARIILELSKNKELAILRDESEFKKISNMIGNVAIEEEGAGSFWKGVLDFFRRTKEDPIEENSIIVHMGFVNNAYGKAKSSIKNIFDGKLLVEEEEFHRKLDQELDLSGLDHKILVQVMVDKKVVFRYKDKKRLFYCIEEPNANNKLQMDIEKEEFVLNARINQLEQQLETISRTVELKTREALDCKNKNKKIQAITILAELRHLKNTSEKLRIEKLYIEKIRFNLINTHSQKELADVLKETNKIIKDNEYIYEDIIKNHDQMKDFEQQNDYINHLITGDEKDDDLESMYKDLNDLSASKIVSTGWAKNLPVIEERKDSSTSEALRKNSQKLKESTFKDMNIINESEVLLKRFTNFEE